MRNKTMKKLLYTTLLVLSLNLVFTGCGGNQKAEVQEAELEESLPEGSLEAQEAQGNVLDNTVNAMLQMNPQPMPGAIGGDWMMFGLARWEGDVPDGWFDTYYEQIEETVKKREGVLHEKKYTEYSRTILALTAMGKDPTNVAGYNLLEPLADFEQTVFQGVNGPVYALLALDSAIYEIPENKTENTQATREMYLEYILSKESEGGGWSLAGGPAEVDMTAMALQALAKYKENPDVEAAIERGLTFLSEQQNAEGGYTTYDVESSESISQVIVALCELGIDLEDERFVKEGNTLEDRLLDFQAENGGFLHMLDGDLDPMATEQAFYALVALERVRDGRPTLYDMRS